MTEILHTLLHPLPNAVMTVIMGILTLYWLFVLISGTGVEDLDLGLDFDTGIDASGGNYTDINVDGDADLSDTDMDVSGAKEPGLFMQFLEYINIGKVPFMLVITTLKFFMWIGSLITTSFLSVVSWGTWSLLILIPISIVSIFVTKFATTPMAKFFEEIGYRGEKEINFFGCAGKMLSNIEGKKIGTAEFIIDKNPIKLNVISFDGQELKYGDYIIIIEESEDKKIYYVSR